MYRLLVPACAALLSGCGDDVRPAPPKLSDVAITTPEDTQVAIAVPLTAAEPAAVSLTVVTPPAHGTLTGTGPSWTYMPAANYAGPDSFVVRAADTHGDSTATASITVAPVNDAPVANPDSFSAAFDVPLTIAQATLLANDTDVDNPTLTVTAVISVNDGHGAPSMAGGNVVFTADASFTGTARFVYTVSDGAATAQGMVTVTVGTDLPPSATDDPITLDEDVETTIGDATLLANDTDPENHTLSITAVGNASHGTVTRTGTQIRWIPDANYAGAASFDYTISDGVLTDVGTVNLTIQAVDDAPVAVDDIATIDEGAAGAAIDVLANDTDIDSGPRTIASITQGAHGAVSITGGGTALAYSAVGYCNDVPNAARDTFSYTLAPGGASATVSVKVVCACGLHKTTDFVVGSVP